MRIYRKRKSLPWRPEKQRASLIDRIKQFQFRDIRPKAASEIADITSASRLLGHTEQEITKKVYRRVGEKVSQFERSA